MADDTFYQWILGGMGLAFSGGFLYLMNSIGKTSDDLAAHKTSVAENYLSKGDFNLVIKNINDNSLRLERRLEDGNKANLDSNEKIRAEMSLGQSTIMTMISNNNKLSAEVSTGTASIIAAIGVTQAQR